MRMVIFFEDVLHYHIARIRALCQLADEFGHVVHAFAIRPSSPELPVGGYHELLNGRIKVLACTPSSGSMNSKSSARQLINELNEIDPDAVAIIGYDSCVPRAALGWCRKHRRGAVLMSETQAKDFPRSAWREWLKSRLVSLYDAAFVGGSPHAAYVRQLGMPAQRIFTGYDVVDNEFWSGWAQRVRSDPQRWRERFGLPDQFFLTACRFVPKKNVSGLLRAYAICVAHADSNPWPLVIVGDGPLSTELHALATSLGLADLARFTGYLSADAMAPIYALASAFILPSAYSEQWGLVVNEAMAAGVPVVVSNICGCAPDLVIEGTTGFTFDPTHEDELAQLLVMLASGVVDLDSMGRAAQERIACFSPEVFATNLLAAAEMATKHAQSRRWKYWPPPDLWP